MAFTSTVVQNEYIVTFRGYYKASARAKFITAALQPKSVHFSIVQRQNPASDYPSDFDVVHVDPNCVQFLNDHPLVRRVTPQRIVQRQLQYIDEHEHQQPTTRKPDWPEFKHFRRGLASTAGSGNDGNFFFFLGF